MLIKLANLCSSYTHYCLVPLGFPSIHFSYNTFVEASSLPLWLLMYDLRFDCFALLIEQVYRSTVEPIIPTIFQRTKATCFAYGQTGVQGFQILLVILIRYEKLATLVLKMIGP